MRHLRSMGLALVAVLSLGALMAGSASAKQNEWERYFSDCPINAENIFSTLSGCIYGDAGSESYFQAGNVTVKFVHPVKMHVGFKENEETGMLSVVAARYGDSISKTPEPAPSLTEGINAELLSPAEKTRYEEYLAAGKTTKVTATIELALPASEMALNEANLLGENSSTALGFPVMIHLSNPFLGKHCYVGNTGEPINIGFITGETNPLPPNTPIHGHLGSISVTGEGTILVISGADLVNNEYAAPGVNGCGAQGSLDAAIDSALALPSPAGHNSTQLIGTLAQTGVESANEHLKFNKVHP